MGKRDKEKSKKYNEIRIIVKDEMDSVLESLSINVQFSFSSKPEVEPTIDIIQNATEEEPTEELSAINPDDPLYENYNY
ncbi:hypothetical protein V7147_07465 [Bacillus sp. JJ1521]|uniref:hypothetical protein n=1 Tax=Bacillus sp. JJ1521 TaxID=3122957 RepID=UPI002FFDCF3B